MFPIPWYKWEVEKKNINKSCSLERWCIICNTELFLMHRRPWSLLSALRLDSAIAGKVNCFMFAVTAEHCRSNQCSNLTGHFDGLSSYYVVCTQSCNFVFTFQWTLVCVLHFDNWALHVTASGSDYIHTSGINKRTIEAVCTHHSWWLGPGWVTTK